MFSALLLAASLPAFEFKGFVAGQEAAPEQLEGCSPDECVFRDDRIAGKYSITSIEFHEGKLFRVIALIYRHSFPDVLLAVNEKYGPPCRQSVDKWKNAMGAALDNPTFTWCFSSGELELSEIGHDVRHMSFIYRDKNRPPDVPKVDF